MTNDRNKDYRSRYWKTPRGKEVKRNCHIKAKHGLTPDQYDKMFKEQDGCCAICKQPYEIDKPKLAVDHNHSTNVIRGLLCQRCNRGIGYLQDDISILNNAIKYLIGNR